MLQRTVQRLRRLLGLGAEGPSIEAWEEHHAPLVNEAAQRLAEYLPEDGVFLDIGANTGLFTRALRAARPAATGHLFEPVERHAARCRERFAGDPRIHVHRIAVGDEDGERTIYKAAHNPGANSLMEDIMFDRRPNSEVREDTVIEAERIQLRHVSAWLDEQGIEHVDVVKSDTEGYDFAVLRGLAPWIERTGCRPAILVELLEESYHPRAAEQRAALDGLERLGYAEIDLADLDGKVGDLLLLPRAADGRDG